MKKLGVPVLTQEHRDIAMSAQGNRQQDVFMPEQVNAWFSMTWMSRIYQGIVASDLGIHGSHPTTHQDRGHQATRLCQPFTILEYPGHYFTLSLSISRQGPFTLKHLARRPGHVNMLIFLCPMQLQITAEQVIQDLTFRFSG